MSGLEALAIPLMVGGTAINAMGAIAQGNAQKAAYDFNAQQQRLQGQQQRNISIHKSQQTGRENLLRAGAMRAAYGAAGVDPNAGSPLELMSDQATQGELSRRLQLWQGVADQQSSNTQASALNAQGKAAQNAGYNSALGSLFNGGAKLAAGGYGGK